MNISAADVNRLRNMTGAGMMDCKKALTEAGGDFDAAVDFLRKKGQKVSDSRSDREAKEGAVIALTSDDGKTGVVVCLNCETDFVAKNDDFVSFARSIAQTALNNPPQNIELLNEMDLNGQSVKNRIIEQVGKIGEKIEIGKYEVLKGELVVSYIHGANRLGVLVSLNQPGTDSIINAAKDAAMQIAAMNPVAVDKDGVDETTINKEIEIGKEQARSEGKPENMLEKIALGKLNKFYKENTLLNQDFVKDGSLTVRQMLEAASKNLSVTAYCRVTL